MILLDSVERYEFSFYYMYEITIYQASILSRKLHYIRITFLKLYAFEEKKQLIYISLSFLQTIVFKVNMPIISNHIDLSCKLKNNDGVTFIFFKLNAKIVYNVGVVFMFVVKKKSVSCNCDWDCLSSYITLLLFVHYKALQSN